MYCALQAHIPNNSLPAPACMARCWFPTVTVPRICSPTASEGSSISDLRNTTRPQYFPLTFAAADGLSVQLPLGYDVGSDLLRGRYLFRARDTGAPTATPVMRL